MFNYDRELVARQQIQDRLHEAEQERLARLGRERNGRRRERRLGLRFVDALARRMAAANGAW